MIYIKNTRAHTHVDASKSRELIPYPSRLDAVNQQTIERKIRSDSCHGRNGRKGMAKRRQKRSVNNGGTKRSFVFARRYIFFPLPLSLFPTLCLSPLQLGVNYVSATYRCFRREWKLLRPRVSKRRRAEGNKINCST